MLFLRSLAIGCLIANGASADPITLQIASQIVTAGQTVNEDVVISGLGLPPEVGAFDVFIGFDPSLLSPTNVAFGPLLGNPSLFEALTAFSLNAGNVEAAEVSLLATPDLDALQSSSFTLATISFDALESGTAEFSYLGGPIDDGNGVLIFGTKQEVPEPPSIVALATCLVIFAWLVRYKRAISIAMGAFALLLCFSGPAAADTAITQAVTPLKGVSAKCSLVTKEADKSLTLTCAFSNSNNNVVRFVFCAMTDLSDAKKNSILGKNRLQPVSAAKSYLLKQTGGNTGTLSCNLVQGGTGAISAWSTHFGCQLVTLQPNEKNKNVPYQSVPGYKVITTNDMGGDPQEYPFNKIKAGDFEVSYTDQVDLTGAPNKKFDDASCKGAVGQGNFIDYDTTTIAESVRSQWAFHYKAFIDPFIVYQPIVPATLPLLCDANHDGFVDLSDVQAILAARNTIAAPGDPRDADHDGLITVNDARICTMRITKQYSLYVDPPCVPSGFPARVPQVPVCPLLNQPAPPGSVDINLFSFYTETETSGTLLPAVLNVTTDGDFSGLRIITNPAENTLFNMIGGVDLIGNLKICSVASSTVCLPPQISDGRRLGVTVNVQPSDSDNPPFFENGQFIQDTQPPTVISSSANFDPSHNLAVQVVANDASTSPVAAELWYSSDGGATWNHVPMTAATDVLQEPSTQTFSGTVGPFVIGQTVLYFVAIEDSVSNITYFGVGQDR